ncbi:hypothetical protein ANN_16620 [Periplaneta americana]|uniref:GIY-YIG domain-containing protein n=1 Tax=Periplaneta americana TaxID=6978 RepID=A0ABQ8SQW4_PERAM|nr:hypothetical protein ANN_16620 [Periplaneta americana]
MAGLCEGGNEPPDSLKEARIALSSPLLPKSKVKDSQGLRTPGIYKIPCECGEVYIGQTGRTIEDRIKEHKRNLRLYYPEKSAVAQHSIEKEHKILFDHTKVINKSSHYWDRTIKEAIEIKLEKNNFNRDSGLQLSQAWTPALDQLRPSYNQGHEDHGPRTAPIPTGGKGSPPAKLHAGIPGGAELTIDDNSRPRIGRSANQSRFT